MRLPRMRFTVRTSLVAIAVLGALSGALSAEEPASAPIDPEWRLVTQAPCIVRARLEVPRATREKISRILAWKAFKDLGFDIPRDSYEKDRRFATQGLFVVRLRVTQVYKGHAADLLTYCATEIAAPSNPSPQTILALDGKEVLAYLDRDGPGQIAEDREILGFVQDPTSLRAFDADKAELIRREVANQRLIVAAFARLPAARPDAMDPVVRNLITQSLDARTEAAALAELQRLGRRAAPAIIRQMADRRELPVHRIDIELNIPGYFEANGTFDAPEVAEAMILILGFGLRENFGFVAGGSDEWFRQVVGNWQTYLHYTGARLTPPVPKKSSPVPQ